MIKSIKTKNLELFHSKDDASKLPSTQLRKITSILTLLEAAKEPQDMNQPGFGLHQLSGDRAGTWSVKVTGNYRITFTFDGEDVIDVRYEDYH